MLEWQHIDIILTLVEWPDKHDQRNKISQWKRIPQIPAAMRTSRRQHSPLPSLSCYGFTGTHLMNLKSHKNASVNKTSTEQDWVRNNLSTWRALKATKPILMFQKIFGFIEDIFSVKAIDNRKKNIENIFIPRRQQPSSQQYIFQFCDQL